ncbi:MAG: CDP-glycerol glycerophosphotransferase family protein [Cyclobacteriaceae bacterium]
MSIILGLFLELFFVPIQIVRILNSRNKVWVCFNYENGTYNDFFINVYLQFLKFREKETKYELAITTNLRYPVWTLDRRYRFMHLFPSFLSPLLFKRVVFHATQLKPKDRVPNELIKHIQINHGFGSFVSVLDSTYIENVSMFIANTEMQFNQLTEGVFKGYLDNKWVRKDGYPKLDGYTKKFQKTNEQPIQTVFYGPTYHREISSLFDFLNPIVTLCRTNRIRLIIKLHPLLYRQFDVEKSGGVDWENTILGIKKGTYENIILLSKDQKFSEVVDLFHNSDLFLTDNSGLGYEYVLLTGKPIVFLGNKLKIPLEDLENKEKYNLYPEIYYRGKIGPVVTVEKFEEVLGSYLTSSTSIYDEAIRDFRRSFTFNLGNASPSIYASTMDLIESWDT